MKVLKHIYEIICMRIYKTYSKHTQNILKTYSKHTQNILKTYSKHTQNILITIEHMLRLSIS